MGLGDLPTYWWFPRTVQFAGRGEPWNLVAGLCF